MKIHRKKAVKKTIKHIKKDFFKKSKKNRKKLLTRGSRCDRIVKLSAGAGGKMVIEN